MITSSKRSAVAAALILSAGALAGCGGDDDADAAGEVTPTPAWDSTPADPAPNPADGETPAATEAADGAAEEEPAAAPGQPAEGGEESAGQPPGGTPGDAAGAPADDDGSDAGAEQPPPDPGGTDDPPPADPVAQAIDACALGAAAIAGVLGANPTPEDISDPADFGPACAWTGTTGHELIVDVSTFDDWVSAADIPGGGAEGVADLGTEAWASLSAPSNLQVAWRRDDVSVTLAASLGNGGTELVDVARIIDAALLAAGY
ncbi:hypothetical protein E1262_03300 [Jiangella aurantiaca]|uniref:DUF3558 domain-containing protein n=1 Tax=Jiangella aurantiaca TaxID=2530373 RepID=A0A4R5ALA2_9ACTN|nr:hypothetical protein [Jiangella aurantiaca]TDD72346.1 hypothetical protein E1262_03300 [Jiangella aurantiaca]